MDKSQRSTKKESKKARINTSYVFQWITSRLHDANYSLTTHENKLQEIGKTEKGY